MSLNVSDNVSDPFLLPFDNGAGLYACATFHIGFPLALASSSNARDWQSLRAQILESIQRSDGLDAIENGLTDVLSFPLGKPVMCKLRSIQEPLEQLNDEAAGIWGVDHRIIIFPTGTVTFCYRAATHRSGLQKHWMVHTVEHQYAWLIENFISFCSHFTATLRRAAVRISFNNLHYAKLLEDVQASGDLSTSEAGQLLNDVYYIEVLSDGNISDRITYVDATLRTGSENWYAHGAENEYNRGRLLSLITIHASISCAVWLDNHIKAISAQQHFQSRSALTMNEHLDQINALKNFAARFIYESEPISISITREYYDLMQTAWDEWRMKDINEHLRQGLQALHEFANWINRKQSERRAIQLSAGLAFLSALTLVSALADSKGYLGVAYENMFSEPLLWAAITVAIAIPLAIYFMGGPMKLRASQDAIARTRSALKSPRLPR